MYKSVLLPQKLKCIRCNYEFIDYVYSSLDSKQCIIAAYLAFQKEIGTVDHDILMSKLLHNGIRGSMHSSVYVLFE